MIYYKPINHCKAAKKAAGTAVSCSAVSTCRSLLEQQINEKESIIYV
ncbi:hypothetical protein [Lacrimispora sp. 210928-DFI.3.58]|nr:hypothetical protein [Lacrimispora sp. 210928-DFI.3.58]